MRRRSTRDQAEEEEEQEEEQVGVVKERPVWVAMRI